MNIITADDIRNMYAGHGQEYRNNNVIRDIVKWLKEFDFTTMVTFRPKKTRINSVNAEKIFLPALLKIEGLRHLFYSVEKDKFGKSSHAHLLLSDDIDKRQFADAINRNVEVELPYWENIKDQDASIVYVNKRQSKNDLVQGFGLLTQVDAEKQIDMDCGITPHPNKKYHDRAEYISSKKYGWKKYHRGYY